MMKDYDWRVFFDYFLAISIMYFAENDVDYIILEAGLGGRFDSTNFIDIPEVSIITSISLDHQAVLGDTIEEIAWQKAGIMKCNRPIFTAQTQCDSVLQVFRQYSNEVNTTLYEVPISYDNDSNIIKNNKNTTTTTTATTSSSSSNSNGNNTRITTKTISDYIKQDMLKYSVQIENACLALAVLNHININPIGMKDFYWPCRMEEFNVDDTTFVLDGCHNGDSVRQFLNGIQKEYPNHAMIVLFGAGKEKCVNDMLSMVMNMSDAVIMVQSKHFKSTSELELWSMINTTTTNTTTTTSTNKHLLCNITPDDYNTNGTINKRMKWILNESKKKNGGVFHDIINNCNHNKYVIAVCGSLFVTAEAREWIYDYNPSLFSCNDWVKERDTM